ncbi:MAG: plasma membrane localization protein [Piccolia ochrophora]|nr:MAG: plasma membrane localization protein [Piccolia ochrophora]
MSTIRQACRPKHQVLVLKCYPKIQKNAAAVKPNSSELSYLLYYTSTRRSKIQKVAAFLEKRTASDVWKRRTSYVQVTLQIVKALIEKSPHDVPLLAPSILRILLTVLRSRDLTMAEETVATFETFCAHHDETSVAADQDYFNQYEEVVQTYANFAAHPAAQSKTPVSAPSAMRWREVGLQAIRCITVSEALGSDGGRQLSVIVPVILQNLYSTKEGHLQMLQQRAQLDAQVDDEKAPRRRMSIATVQTHETNEVRAPTVSATTADADKVAEEDIGLLALQSLKQIFLVNIRGQIRTATAATLDFIMSKLSPEHTGRNSPSLEAHSRWAATLMEMAARWAPVQDRYMIVVTAMETLAQSPVSEENLERQLALANLIGWLLSSDVNLIGLSVMDVLLGLVQHVLSLLQLGGHKASIQPHPQQKQAAGTEGTLNGASKPNSLGDGPSDQVTAIVATPSPTRVQLLARLQTCMGDLATHFYYSDQISDMVAAILVRLKPSPMSSVGTAVSAIENPAAAAQVISESAQIQEIPNTDAFFSFDTARVTALMTIKEILAVANMRGSHNGSSAVGRNRVGLQVWEGTQWLLRDSDGRVRKAYVDALLTWLDMEVTRNQLQALDERPATSKFGGRGEKEDLTGAHLAKRVTSTTSTRERVKPPKSMFLQLLHLAIYDNAVDHADSESDILLMHLLLFTLVNKLGVNAAKSGLPMMVRLQEDIQVLESPTAKVRLGSLVHGYFWALSDKFDFDVSTVGRAIQAEVGRRKRRGMWMEKVTIPPLTLEHINAPGKGPIQEVVPEHTAQSEFLKPFDGRVEMVERIATAYTDSFASPPSSPPASPARRLTITALSTTSISSRKNEEQLPADVKEQMLSSWDKEAVIAICEKENTKTASLTGSKGGTSVGRKFLAVNGNREVPSGSGTNTPQHHHHRHHSPSPVGALGLGALHRLRQSSPHDGSPTPLSTSSRSSTLRADDLKRVMSGVGPTTLRNRRSFLHDTDTESMVSVDYVPSESSYAGYDRREAVETTDFASDLRSSRRAQNSTDETVRPSKASATNGTSALDSTTTDSAAPPIPSLPGTFPSSTPTPPRADSFTSAFEDHPRTADEPSRKSHSIRRGKERIKGDTALEETSYSRPSSGRTQAGSRHPVVDLNELLSGIETGEGHREGKPNAATGLSRPPY